MSKELGLGVFLFLLIVVFAYQVESAMIKHAPVKALQAESSYRVMSVSGECWVRGASADGWATVLEGSVADLQVEDKLYRSKYIDEDCLCIHVKIKNHSPQSIGIFENSAFFKPNGYNFQDQSVNPFSKHVDPLGLKPQKVNCEKFDVPPEFGCGQLNRKLFFIGPQKEFSYFVPFKYHAIDQPVDKQNYSERFLTIAVNGSCYAVEDQNSLVHLYSAFNNEAPFERSTAVFDRFLNYSNLPPDACILQENQNPQEKFVRLAELKKKKIAKETQNEFGQRFSGFDWQQKDKDSRVACVFFRSVAKCDMGEYEDALADCNTAIELCPRLATVHDLKARILNHLGQYHKALNECNDYHVAPGYLSAYAHYGLHEYGKGLADCDHDPFLKAGRGYEDYISSIRMVRGLLNSGLGKYDEALADFEKAIQKTSHQNISESAYDKILAWDDRCLVEEERRLRNGQVYFLRSLTFLKAGKPALAEVERLKAIRLGFYPENDFNRLVY